MDWVCWNWGSEESARRGLLSLCCHQSVRGALKSLTVFRRRHDGAAKAGNENDLVSEYGNINCEGPEKGEDLATSCLTIFFIFGISCTVHTYIFDFAWTHVV